MFLLLWVLWYPIIVPVIAVNNTFRGVIVKALVWLQTTLKSPKSSHCHVLTVKLLLVQPIHDGLVK